MNKETTLILGDGFLAQEFIRQGYKNFTSRKFLNGQYVGKMIHPDQKVFQFDWEDYAGILNFAEFLDYEVYPEIGCYIDTVINCIGCADTRFCEKRENFETIQHINGDLPGIVSNACEMQGAKFVHVSSGCLYKSDGYLVNEHSSIEAHCNYVVSKWIGEMGCNPEKDLIIRPRLYFSHHKHKLNLICKFEKFKYILNELNSVTSTRTIVEAVTALLENNQSGIFNVCNEGNYTIKQISEAIGYKWTDDQIIRGDELRKQQGLYLVNNTMDISKLQQFYQPHNTIDEIQWCYENLK